MIYRISIFALGLMPYVSAYILDAGSVIPDVIRDRHDDFGLFTKPSKFSSAKFPTGDPEAK